MSPRLLCAALTVTLAGCAPPGFERLGPLTMKLSGIEGSLAAVTLTYDEQEQDCQALDEDFSVEADGVAAEVVSRGRSYWGSSGMGLGGPECELPGAFIHRVGILGVTSTVTASTGGDTMVMEVADLGSNLSAHPILAPGEWVHAGQLVHLAVDPGFDRVEWPESAQISVEVGSNVQRGYAPISPPSAEGVLDVQLPSTMPAGPMRVLVSVTGHPRITRCEGPSACATRSWSTVDFTAQFFAVP